MPERVVSRAVELLGSLDGLHAVVLGAAYRGGVKETAFSGVFATVAALESRGARVSVHDPLYTGDELSALGFTAFHVGETADVVVVQTDHAEYRTLTPAGVPGVRLLLDGRNVTDAATWTGVPRLVLGQGG
jgi:UDP-N-acetyl-D-mannosaminuronate dehydrogenase